MWELKKGMMRFVYGWIERRYLSWVMKYKLEGVSKGGGKWILGGGNSRCLGKEERKMMVLLGKIKGIRGVRI